MGRYLCSALRTLQREEIDLHREMNKLVEEIFAPAVVAAAEHAHDLTAGVERKRTRVALKGHVVDLAEHAVALAAVAGMATGDKVLPCGVAAAGTRNDVV